MANVLALQTADRGGGRRRRAAAAAGSGGGRRLASRAHLLSERRSERLQLRALFARVRRRAVARALDEQPKRRQKFANRVAVRLQTSSPLVAPAAHSHLVEMLWIEFETGALNESEDAGLDEENAIAFRLDGAHETIIGIEPANVRRRFACRSPPLTF